MNKNTKQFSDCIIYLLFACFYLWMAAQIPYTHDDWDWGLPVGIQQLITANLNGRYAGNFLEVVMTRSKLLKAIIMAAGFTFVPYFVADIAVNNGSKNQKCAYFVLCNILLLLMDQQVWQQTYGWIAGFANFVASAVFLLIVLKEGLAVFDEINPTSHAFSIRCTALLVLGVVSQLFLENVALFLVLFSLAVNWIYYKRTGSVSKPYVCLALGTVIGLVILFSSDIFEQLWSTGEAVDGYRKLYMNANTSIGEFIRRAVYQGGVLLYNMFINNLLMYSCLSLMLNAVILLKIPHRTTWPKGCLYINSGFFAFFVLYGLFDLALPSILISGLNLVYFLVVAGEIILVFRDAKLLMGKLLLTWVSPFVLIAPLVVTSEFGARLYFVTYALMALLVLLLLNTVIDRITPKMYRPGMICAAVAAIVLVIFYGNVYFSIGVTMRQRNEIIAQAAESGAQEITMPAFPHLDYLWAPNPQNDLRLEYFKEFYGISPEVTVIFE